MVEKRETVTSRGLTKGLLALLAGGAAIGTALVFPAAGIIYKEFKKQKWEEARRRGVLGSTIKRLEKQSVVAWKEVGGEVRLFLTENGKKKNLQFSIDNLQIKKAKKWDKLWRIIIFDIPEAKKQAREIFRRKLKDLEFEQLQKSVFVSRHECKNEIDFLRHALGIAPFVNYVVAKEISGIEKV